MIIINKKIVSESLKRAEVRQVNYDDERVEHNSVCLQSEGKSIQNYGNYGKRYKQNDGIDSYFFPEENSQDNRH